MALSPAERKAFQQGVKARTAFRAGMDVHIPYPMSRSREDFWLGVAWVEGAEHAHEQITHGWALQIISDGWVAGAHAKPGDRCPRVTGKTAGGYRMAYRIARQIAAMRQR